MAPRPKTVNNARSFLRPVLNNRNKTGTFTIDIAATIGKATVLYVSASIPVRAICRRVFEREYSWSCKSTMSEISIKATIIGGKPPTKMTPPEPKTINV